MNKLQAGDLQISDYGWASENGHRFDWVLSITEPEANNTAKGHKAQSIHRFHDCNKPYALYVHPTMAITRSILDSCDQFLADDNLHTALIHCAAGVSRSTASALMLLLRDGWSVEDATQHVFKLRPFAAPNELLLVYIDQIFALNGRLHAEVSKYKTAYQQGVWDRLGERASQIIRPTGST